MNYMQRRLAINQSYQNKNETASLAIYGSLQILFWWQTNVKVPITAQQQGQTGLTQHKSILNHFHTKMHAFSIASAPVYLLSHDYFK